MKRSLMVLFACLVAGSAFADVTLTNKDASSHDITIKCGSGSTTQTSIGSNVTRGIGTGPCTVTVKDNGSTYSAQDGDKIVIKTGN